jgi:hypothetical protein
MILSLLVKLCPRTLEEIKMLVSLMFGWHLIGFLFWCNLSLLIFLTKFFFILDLSIFFFFLSYYYIFIFVMPPFPIFFPWLLVKPLLLHDQHLFIGLLFFLSSHLLVLFFLSSHLFVLFIHPTNVFHYL